MLLCEQQIDITLVSQSMCLGPWNVLQVIVMIFNTIITSYNTMLPDLYPFVDHSHGHPS